MNRRTPDREWELWERFCSTGQIGDYLAYRGLEDELPDEDSMENADADFNRSIGD